MRPLRAALTVALVLLAATGSPAAAQTTTGAERMEVGPARLIGPDVMRLLNGAPTPEVGRASVPSRNASSLNKIPDAKNPPLLPPEALDGAPRAEIFNYGPRLAKSWLSHTHSGEPADPMVAVGTAHVVSVVNFRIIVNDKSGNELFNSSLNTFFGVPLGEPIVFDTKVAYDKNDDRFWIIAISAACGTSNKSRVYVGLTSTGDPTAGWMFYGPYSNLFDNNWGDYPGLGVGDRTLTLTWNYIPCPGATVGHRNAVWVFHKTPMLTGGGTFVDPFYDVRGWNGDWPGTMVPAIAWGTPSGAENFISALQYDAGTDQIRPTLIGLQLPVDYPTGFPTLNVQSATAPNPGAIQLAEQRGGPAKIVTWNLGAPPFSCVYRNGHVWAASHYAYGTAGASQVVTYDWTVSSWPTITCANSGFTDGSSDYYWPAVAANQFGDAVTVFSRSSATEYVGSRFTMRFAGEPGFNSSQALQAGLDYYGEAGDTPAIGYRWGDYAGCAVDPVNEGFWVFNKHASTGVGGSFNRRWGSRIGYIPRAVFVDVAHPGTQNGRRSSPWRTVTLGHISALGGNDLVIRTGSYAEAVTLNKPVTIIPDGGPVTIGR